MIDGQRRMELGQHAEMAEGTMDGGELGSRLFIPQRMWVQVVEAVFHGPEGLLVEAWADLQASAVSAGLVTGLQNIVRSPERAIPLFRDTFFICFSSRWPSEAHRIRVELALRVRPAESIPTVQLPTPSIDDHSSDVDPTPFRESNPE